MLAVLFLLTVTAGAVSACTTPATTSAANVHVSCGMGVTDTMEWALMGWA